MLKLLAFDYGAGSGRAMLGNYDGKQIKLTELHRFSNDPVHVTGRLHWDTLRLFHEMKKGISICNSKGNRGLASIGIDTWGVDFGLLDSSGRLLSNPYHYRDENTEGMIEEACKIVPRREIYMHTGIQLQLYNTLYQLLSMTKKNPRLLESASTMLLMPDLFRYFLTGEKSTEFTIASTTQMLNAESRSWDEQMLTALGIPQNILTKIIEPGTLSGKLTASVSEELNIGPIPVAAVAGHDTASAIVSVPATTKEYAYLSSGTWSLLGVESSTPIINEDTYTMNYTNEGGFNRKTRLLKNIIGLWILQECKRYWEAEGQSSSFAELDEGAAQAEPFMSFIDPDDMAFYKPGKMPIRIQDFCRLTGQRVPVDKYQITRCILESLALKYRMAIEGLDKIVGYRIPVLHIVGGGCKNKMLSQFTANAINRPVIAGPIEATAIGNIICQLVALGEIKDLSQGRAIVEKSFPSEVFTPQDTSLWEDAYGKFTTFCKDADGQS